MVILDDAEHKVPTQGLGAPTDSVVEVEEAIAVDENDIGADSQRHRVKNEAEDVEMANTDPPDVDADAEENVSPKRERTASPSPTPRKRRRSRNAKSDIVEETDSRASNVPAAISRRSRSQVEVVVPPRSGHVPPRNGDSSTKVKKSASHKVVASESPVASKKSSPVKMRTPARKSIPAFEEDSEEEPVSAKRVLPKLAKKRKRHETSSEEEQSEESEKPIPGPSKPKSTRATQQHLQESSPPPALTNDVPARGRRSAAQRADEKLKDIMPDVINFQKQMKRGVVVGEWEKKDPDRMDKTKEKDKEKEKEKEKAKENTRQKAKETANRRRSDTRYRPSGVYFRRLGPDNPNHSTKEAEEEESEEERATPKRTGGDVHVMTTKVHVSEDTKKVGPFSDPNSTAKCRIDADHRFQALTKLGAKFTEKPLECTHLIASAFGRTEKLLSSIAVAPFILRDEWLTKSAAKGRFLRELVSSWRVRFF